MNANELYRSPIVHTHATNAQVAEAIEGDSHYWYAIVDACGETEVPIRSRQLKDQSVCLYRGKAERDFWAVAPYLWKLDVEGLSWITETLGEKPWGILIRTTDDFEQTRRHCRRFLIVDGPDDKELYFRFYDPRVLPTFVRSLQYEQMDEFFGNHLSYTCPLGKEAYENFHRYSVNSSRPPNQQMAVGETLPIPIDVQSSEYMEWLVQRLNAYLIRMQKSFHIDAIRSQAQRGILRATQYGLSNSRDVTSYIETMCFHAGGFTDRPDPIAVQECLADTRYEMALRVTRLMHLVRGSLTE